MSQNNSPNNKETLALSLTLLMTLALAGGGVWYYTNFVANNGNKNPTTATYNSPSPAVVASASPTPTNSPSSPVDPLAAIAVSLPNPKVLAMDGSVTMIRPIKRLQNAYAQKYPNMPTTYGIPDLKPNGSNKGLQALIDDKIAIAASSRPLKAQETQADLVAVPIAKDALAVVIGISNSFKGGLTSAQLSQIFQGKITNWKEVGGGDLAIKVINRSSDSGTNSLFKSLVLEDQAFAPDGKNFITWKQDETTPILRQIGKDGISYTTVSQAEGQEMVRIVAINGVSPTNISVIQDGSYFLSRHVFLVVRKQVSAAVKDFIDLALSDEGQKVVRQAGFVPIK